MKFHNANLYVLFLNCRENMQMKLKVSAKKERESDKKHRRMGHGFRFLLPLFPTTPHFFKFSYKSFLFQNFHNHSLSNEEKTNDYENFEKGIIYMKILKKGGRVLEKRGRRKRNPCPMRLCFVPVNVYH